MIIPGYSLPDHLFNNGKPFYVEKNPLTGAIDFNNKTSSQRDLIEYDYIEDEDATQMYDKSSIDRKDDGFGSHGPNDVNQLSPNFHDFLNLPVKYNPEKYVYPLISSSYANTKIQGNVINKNNHKFYTAASNVLTVSPTYYTTRSSVYTLPTRETTTKAYVYTTPTSTTTTKEPLNKVYLTTQKPDNQQVSKNEDNSLDKNLLNSPMNHPSYLTTLENDYDYDYYTTQDTNEHHRMTLTTNSPNKNINSHNNVRVSSTEKPYSIFDELFGNYDAPVEKPAISNLFANMAGGHLENKVSSNDDKNFHITASSTNSKVPLSNSNTAPTHHNSDISNSADTHYNYDNSNTKPNNVNPAPVNKNDDSYMYEYDDDYSDNNKVSSYHITENITEQPEVSNNKPTTEQHFVENPVRTSSNNDKSNVINENTTKEAVNNNTKYSEYRSPSITQDSSSSKMKENKTFSEKNYVSQNFNQQDSDHLISITTDRNNHEAFIGYTELPQKSNAYKQNDNQQYTTRVTSMPLGENYSPITKLPIISLTQHIRDALNQERYDVTTKSYTNGVTPQKHENFFMNNKQTILHEVPSTSNIHIAPDQDVVSFVVGNHQSIGSGHFAGSALPTDTYISNSFRPLYSQQVMYNQPVIKNVENVAPPSQVLNYSISGFVEPTLNVQQIKGSETSISIGIPADKIKTVPGQIVDEKLDINEDVEYPKNPGAKIVFPEEDFTMYTSPKVHTNQEILSLYSKPMFHQLPADLTPPSEPDVKPLKTGSPRPPWDPRPGHFYQGRPEYARPPRPPHKPEVFKRMDGLPNILPQFRPNAKVSNDHYMDTVGTINTGYMPRQPLLDRPPVNRHVGFFEKLHPPPPTKKFHNLGKVTNLESEMKDDRFPYEKRFLNVNQHQDHHEVYHSPPKVPIANRKSDDEADIATLQMIQAKLTDKLDTIKPNVPPPFKINYEKSTEKPLYVVYPINSAPLKLHVLDNDNKETVVIGTRGEQLPLPPSKINQELIFDQKTTLLQSKEKKDSPILQPHSRPNSYPVKSDFPYTLERPDPILANAPSLPASSNLNVNLSYNQETPDSTTTFNKNEFVKKYPSNNQWTSVKQVPQIVTGNKINYSDDQITATLKTYSENPIAIAYTPTESANVNIPEIHIENRTGNMHHHGTVSNNDSEFTVSAVMHTHTQIKPSYQEERKTIPPILNTRKTAENYQNHKHRLDVDTTHVPTKLNFQAPFYASMSVDAENQRWSVVNNNRMREVDRADVDMHTTVLPQTSSEFNIKNFNPQLFGGFKPIFNIPEENDKNVAASERQE